MFQCFEKRSSDIFVQTCDAIRPFLGVTIEDQNDGPQIVVDNTILKSQQMRSECHHNFMIMMLEIQYSTDPVDEDLFPVTNVF